MTITAKEVENSYRNGELDLSWQGLLNEDALVLVTILKERPDITRVNLENNNLYEEAAEALAALPLEYLNLEGNSVGDKGALALGKSRIKELNLTYNGMTRKGILEFAEICTQIEVTIDAHRTQDDARQVLHHIYAKVSKNVAATRGSNFSGMSIKSLIERTNQGFSVCSQESGSTKGSPPEKHNKDAADSTVSADIKSILSC